jgi:hypothetical protein
MKTRLAKVFRLLSLTAIAVVVQACVSMASMDGATQSFGSRMSVSFPNGWNKLSLKMGAAEILTREGIAVDQMIVYSGIQEGTDLLPPSRINPNRPKIIYKKVNSPNQLQPLFQALMTGEGSQLTMEKVAPAELDGRKAIRFEYGLIMKTTNARMQGIAVATIDKDELFMVGFTAPRLVFFPRDKENFERVLASVKIK